MFKYILVAMTVFAGAAFADQNTCGPTSKYSGTSALENGITTFYNPGSYKDGRMTHAFVDGGNATQICMYLGMTKFLGKRVERLNQNWDGTTMFIDDKGNWQLDPDGYLNVITTIHCQ